AKPSGEQRPEETMQTPCAAPQALPPSDARTVGAQSTALDASGSDTPLLLLPQAVNALAIATSRESTARTRPIALDPPGNPPRSQRLAAKTVRPPMQSLARPPSLAASPSSSDRTCARAARANREGTRRSQRR